MGDMRDRPDPDLPLKDDSIDLDLADLTPAAAIKLIESAAAKLIDPRIRMDRDCWEPVTICGKRHMSRREFEHHGEDEAARRQMRERSDRAVLERIRTEHPDWLAKPPPE